MLENEIENRLINEFEAPTGMKFHEKITIILKELHSDGVAPKQLGGDGGVDFISFDDETIYAIDGQTSNKTSDIKRKFLGDIKQINEKVILQGEWKGKVKKIVGIFQTFDQELPNYFQGRTGEYNDDLRNIFINENMSDKSDESDESDEKKSMIIPTIELKKAKDLINCLSLNQKKKVALHLKVIDIGELDNSKIYNEISNVVDTLIAVTDDDIQYKRISTTKKITDNFLDEEFIEDCIDELNFTLNLSKWINKERGNERKWKRFKEKIIRIYNEKSEKYENMDLLNEIIEECCALNVDYNIACLLVVFIFDHCDIF